MHFGIKTCRVLAAILMVVGLLATAPSVASAQAQPGYYDVEFPVLVSLAGPAADADIRGLGLSGDGDWIVWMTTNPIDDSPVITATNWRTDQVRTRTFPSLVTSDLTSLQVSNNASRVVFSSEDAVYVLEMASEFGYLLPGAAATPFPMISPDGKFVAIEGAGVWQVDNGTKVDLPPRFIAGFSANNEVIVLGDLSNYDQQDQSWAHPPIDLYDPISGQITASYLGTNEMCLAGIGVCNAVVADQVYGFSVKTGDARGFEYLDLMTQSSGDGKMFVQFEEGDPTFSALVLDIDSGYEVARADTIGQIIDAYDYGPDEASVMRLYQAFFNRPPDVGGAKYWIDILQSGYTLEAISSFMSDSQEFANLYSDKNNADYVEAVYMNVLGRDYDQEGYDYWLGLLNDGQLTRAGVVHWVTANQEFIQNYPFTN